MRHYALFFFLLFTGCLSAQSYKISGVITDADDHSTLTGAIIKLLPRADTTAWKAVEADIDGKFEFAGLPNGGYRLQVSYIGYKKLEKKVKIAGADRPLGEVAVAKDATVLGDVDIVAKQARVIQKADTSEYNANSYKTNPDATGEDLVTKMPGITSENGTVKAQGETVQKVYVDGKEFFGDDATMALKNLPAEIIDKVQVFDRMSDQAQFTGFDDGSTQKSLNIITKNGRNNGVFGKVYGGYGYLDDSRYAAGANINWFKGERRLSFIGLSNNVNQQNFATQDLVGISGSGSSGRGGGGGAASSIGRRPSGGGGGGFGGGGSGGGGGSSTNNFLVGQQGGISTTHSAGLNYTDMWGKKVKVTGSYFFNLSDNVNPTQLTRSYFNAGDSSTVYNENSRTESHNINHRVNLRMEYAIDSMNKLVFSPKASVQQNNQTNQLFGQNTIGGGELTGQTQSDYMARNLGYNISGDLLYQHRFRKPRRTISFSVSGGANNKDGNTSLQSSNLYFGADDSTQLDQRASTLTNSYNIAGSINYTEPVGKTGMLQFNYSPANNWNIADKQTYNYDSATAQYNLVDTTLSSRYDNIYMTQRGGLSYRLSTKRITLMLGANAQYALLQGEQVLPLVTNTRKQFFNVLPSAMLMYKFNDLSNVRINYRTSTNPPSIAQLQSVIDNTNPLLLSTGNPNLKQTFGQNLLVRYSITNKQKTRAFFAFASANYTMNYVGNNTLIAANDTVLPGDVLLRAGSQLTSPVNLKQGNWNVNSFFTYSLPLDKIKSNLNLNAGFTYGRTPSLINNIQNLSNTYNVNGGFVLSSNISDKIDFTVGYTANYNIVNNSLQTSSNNNYFTHSATGKFNWMFWKGFLFNTSVQNTLYAGIAQGFNQNIVLWNAALGYKFFKEKSLEVKFGVNDILNQNTGISRTINETYVEDTRTQVLKRYLMLTVTYTLRFFKKPAAATTPPATNP